jgi:hypothetical protein
MTAALATSLALLLAADPPARREPAASAKPGATTGTAKAAPAAAEAWTDVDSEEAGVSIRFPGTPELRTTDVDLPGAGGKMRMWMWASGSEQGGIGYLLMVMRVTGDRAEKEMASASQEDLAKLVAQGRDDFIAKSEATLVRDEPVSIGGAVGRDMVLAAQGTRTRLLMAQQGTRLYQLMARASDDATLEAAKPFFASFRPRGPQKK